MILYKENFIEDLINHGLFSHFSQDSTFKVSTKYSRKKIYGYTLQVGKKKKLLKTDLLQVMKWNPDHIHDGKN